MQIPVQSNYCEIHQPLSRNPLATIGNPLAVIGKLTIEAKGFSGWGLMDFLVVGKIPIEFL